MVIAIDGPSGSGKTSTAKLLSEKLNFYYCDSGSLYRAVTYYFINNEINLDNDLDIKNALDKLKIKYNIFKNSIKLNDYDVSKFLRSYDVTQNVSRVSSMKIVRDFLIDIQRKLARNNDIILDGRDIGTTVFPEADYKFYIDADIEVRAKRRFHEINVKDNSQDYKKILKAMKERDSYDQNRKYSPLRKAEDAVCIDTTSITLDEQVNKIIDIIKKLKESSQINE